jgi:TatD DNase family protein
MAGNPGAIALAEAHAFIHVAVGVHPHDVAKMTDADWQEVATLAAHPRCVAVGETGLDLYYGHSPRAAQEEAFRRFAALARAVRRPLVVHLRDKDGSREAFQLAARILEEEGASHVGGQIHCYTGGREDAERYLSLGFYISWSGILTFRNAEPLREVARAIPLERTLIETDAPYLAPVPYRGKRNEPAFVTHTGTALATLLSHPVDEVARVTYAAARALFRLPKD